jgi:hypothetical protein
MISKDPKMNKQGVAGKRKHVTLREVTASYIGSSAIYDIKKQKDQL